MMKVTEPKLTVHESKSGTGVIEEKSTPLTSITWKTAIITSLIILLLIPSMLWSREHYIMWQDSKEKTSEDKLRDKITQILDQRLSIGKAKTVSDTDNVLLTLAKETKGFGNQLAELKRRSEAHTQSIDAAVDETAKLSKQLEATETSLEQMKAEYVATLEAMNKRLLGLAADNEQLRAQILLENQQKPATSK